VGCFVCFCVCFVRLATCILIEIVYVGVHYLCLQVLIRRVWDLRDDVFKYHLRVLQSIDTHVGRVQFLLDPLYATRDSRPATRAAAHVGHWEFVSSEGVCRKVQDTVSHALTEASLEKKAVVYFRESISAESPELCVHMWCMAIVSPETRRGGYYKWV
jgi:hypothetical protein